MPLGRARRLGLSQRPTTVRIAFKSRFCPNSNISVSSFQYPIRSIESVVKSRGPRACVLELSTRPESDAVLKTASKFKSWEFQIDCVRPTITMGASTTMGATLMPPSMVAGAAGYDGGGDMYDGVREETRAHLRDSSRLSFSRFSSTRANGVCRLLFFRTPRTRTGRSRFRDISPQRTRDDWCRSSVRWTTEARRLFSHVRRGLCKLGLVVCRWRSAKT